MSFGSSVAVAVVVAVFADDIVVAVYASGRTIDLGRFGVDLCMKDEVRRVTCGVHGEWRVRVRGTVETKARRKRGNIIEEKTVIQVERKCWKVTI